jgi:hypothetical protein
MYSDESPRRHVDSANHPCTSISFLFLLLYSSICRTRHSYHLFHSFFPFVEFTGSRSPAPLPPHRERDRDVWDEAREREYHYEVPAPPFQDSSVPIARSDRSEKDRGQPEWERPKQYESSRGPESVQEYARWPIDDDIDSPRERNLERERVREGERDRDLHSSRRGINTGIDADHPPMRHPPEPSAPEPRGSQSDTKSKRSEENYGRKPEESHSARKFLTALPCIF